MMQAHDLLRLIDDKHHISQYDSWGWVDFSGVYDLPPVTAPKVKVSIEEKNEHVEGSWHTDLYVILKAEHSDGSVQYFKKTGYYQSHEGATWDGAFVEVKPQTKTVTVWDDTDNVTYGDGNRDDDSYSY